MYSRNIKDKQLTFGVSGRLYKSNVLIYDHQTESLWSQLMDTAISGPMVGTGLQKLVSRRTAWSSWKKRYPETKILSTNTGYSRNYSIDPYEGYYRIGTIMFPVGDVRRDLSPKSQVLGIEINGTARAYPLEDLKRRSAVIRERLGDEEIKIEIDTKGQVFDVTDAKGSPIPYLFAYWFAWQAFHPDTSVYRAAD